jgi:pyridoxine/pyridoxamine 5'-phosphate oxidase
LSFCWVDLDEQFATIGNRDTIQRLDQLNLFWRPYAPVVAWAERQCEPVAHPYAAIQDVMHLGECEGQSEVSAGHTAES